MVTTIAITGTLDFDSVPRVWKHTLEKFQTAGPAVQIDFSAVSACNSAALVLILEWIVLAKNLSISLVFSGVPERLMAIAAACGISQVLDGAP